MGILVCILGESGSGKTSSLRNFNKGEIAVFNPAGKPLPFGNKLDICDKPTYNQIEASLKANNFNAYVIDDSNYLTAFSVFKFADTKGYEKWTQMAKDYYNLLQVAANTNDNSIIYFFSHPEVDEAGTWKPKVAGKMLDNTLTNIAGLFTFVFIADNTDGQYRFFTSSKRNKAVKAGFGIFEEDEIDNDLKLIDTKLRGAYGLAPLGAKPKKAVSTPADEKEQGNGEE